MKKCCNLKLTENCHVRQQEKQKAWQSGAEQMACTVQVRRYNKTLANSERRRIRRAGMKFTHYHTCDERKYSAARCGITLLTGGIPRMVRYLLACLFSLEFSLLLSAGEGRSELAVIKRRKRLSRTEHVSHIPFARTFCLLLVRFFFRYEIE